MAYVTIILVISAAVFNTVMDLSSEDRFINPWWSKTASSNNKYKNGDSTQGPKFFLSTTALVFLTDGWHLAQFLFHTSWQLAIAINMPYPLWSFIGAKVLFSGTFEVIYKSMKEMLTQKARNNE